MSIEVTLKKVRLTKTLANQFRYASADDVLTGKVLGRMRNVVKDLPDCLLIEINGEYAVAPCNYAYSDVDRCVWRRTGKYTRSCRTFETKEKLDEFWAVYVQAVKSAEQIFV